MTALNSKHMSRWTIIGVMALCFTLSACRNIESKQETPSPDEVKISDFDNRKYVEVGEMFKYGIGLALSNAHWEEKMSGGEIFAERNTLLLDDANKPITVKFNSNGRDRNFVITAYYDYEPTAFKITSGGGYAYDYRFELSAGKEIELPLFLPEELPRDGAHKLLFSVIIGADIHAGTFDEQLTWYGITQLYDIIYDSADEYAAIVSEVSFEEAQSTDVGQYAFSFSEDFDNEILADGILRPMPNTIEAAPNEEVSLVLNMSDARYSREDFLVLLTCDFARTPINGKPYELARVNSGETGVKGFSFIAPNEPGEYEVFAYLVCNPFERFDVGVNSIVENSQRITLIVK